MKDSDEEPTDISLVTVDPYNLDKEWVAQPKRYLKAAQELAKYRDRVAEMKAALDLAEASLGIRIRSDPDTHKVDKVTESSISAAVKTHPEYTEAVKKLNKAKYKAEMAEALVTALEHRKRALEKMVDLHAMSYFANPKSKYGDKQTAEDIAARAAFGKRKHGKKD